MVTFEQFCVGLFGLVLTGLAGVLVFLAGLLRENLKELKDDSDANTAEHAAFDKRISKLEDAAPIRGART